MVLVHPQIPQNTGNIVRTCAAVGAHLVLVAPLGFHLEDRHLRRAGLDYWEGVEVRVISDFSDWLIAQSERELPFFFSSHATSRYSDAPFSSQSILVFGSESSGLPDWMRERWHSRFLRLPMLPGKRCLNLANSVSIALYEAWRQCDFIVDSL